MYGISNNDIELMPKSSLKDVKVEQLKLIVPSESDPTLFIETGKQKHLLVVTDDQGTNHVIGYLTNKNSATFISNQQF
jgi:hypothetical protein